MINYYTLLLFLLLFYIIVITFTNINNIAVEFFHNKSVVHDEDQNVTNSVDQTNLEYFADYCCWKLYIIIMYCTACTNRVEY